MYGVKQLLTRQFHTDAVSIGWQLVLLAHSCEANIQYPYGLHQLLISTEKTKSKQNVNRILANPCKNFYNFDTSYFGPFLGPKGRESELELLSS